MTIKDLRDCLFEVREQEQEIDFEEVGRIMSLWDRYKSIDRKIDELTDESINPEFIRGWQKEKAETLNLIRNYKSR